MRKDVFGSLGGRVSTERGEERVREERELMSLLFCVFLVSFFPAGSRVVKYNPDGSIGLEIRFPKAANITCCIFGGQP